MCANIYVHIYRHIHTYACIHIHNTYMHAKSLQSCPTLCNSMNQGLPGSTIHGILQATRLEWLLCPPPRELPDSGIDPGSLLFPALAGGFFTTSTIQESPLYTHTHTHTHTHVYIYTMEYYSVIKKNKIMPFAATQMKLEIIILSNSEKEKYHMVSLTCEI